MSKRKILFYLCLIVFVLVFVYFGYAWGKKVWPFGEPKYQAVQLISGDIYYGKLRTFPCFKFSNVYFVQRTQLQEEGGESGTQLVPLSSLFFSPENEMHLNKDQILWWADLQESSQVLQLIKQQEKK